LSKANWSGLAKNMFFIMAGSSSLRGFCTLLLGIVGGRWLLLVPGTLMELKSSNGMARATFLSI
jgi:hypothetical protein